MEAELDLQPSLLHQCRAGPLVLVPVLVLAAEDNYNSEPAPKPEENTPSFLVGHPPRKQLGK